MNCQHFGNICQLEGFCAPFGRRVEECTFSYMYTCIGYKLPIFGEYMSVGGFLCVGEYVCSLRTSSRFQGDNFPLDKFLGGQVPQKRQVPGGQLPPGHVPGGTSSWVDKFLGGQVPPGQSPGGTSTQMDKFHGQEVVRGEVIQGELVC